MMGNEFACWTRVVRSRGRTPIDLCFCIHLRFYRRCWGWRIDFHENRMSMDSREQMAPPWLQSLDGWPSQALGRAYPWQRLSAMQGVRRSKPICLQHAGVSSIQI